MKFIIYAYPYDENSGGVIALHRLCHIINEYTEHKAFLYSVDFDVKTRKKIKNVLCGYRHKLKVNSNWNTPEYTSFFMPFDDYIAIYPEIVSGNPLKAKKVVRWFLHNPGYFTGEINFGKGELYFKYTSAFNKYVPSSDSFVSSELLTVMYLPIDLYREDSSIIKDIDTSYIVRKGKGRAYIHSENSVCVDGLSHAETAQILKRSKNFISYDLYTSYSTFASIAGCNSYIVPDENLSLDKWIPDECGRYGIAYGFSEAQIKWAGYTKNKLIKQVEEQNADAILSVNRCLKIAINYFKM